MASVTYVERVLRDGHLSLPKSTVRELKSSMGKRSRLWYALRAGTRKVLPRAHQTCRSWNGSTVNA